MSHSFRHPGQPFGLQLRARQASGFDLAALDPDSDRTAKLATKRSQRSLAAALEQELMELDLLAYCRDALDRFARKT